jgi:peptidoglycan/LPS O-acetylase OafA/YrhL
VGYHAGVPGFSGGFVGVDVFFVISGFLITRVLLDSAASGTIDLADFYARRARRILPALFVVLLFTMAAMPLVSVTTHQVEFAAASAVATLFFYSNVFFRNQADNYFAPQLDTVPLLHTWSLAIEEQFYLVWPLAILTLAILARRWQRDVIPLATWFFAVALTSSLAFSVWSTSHDPVTAFYLMPSRAWELAAGALLVVGAPRLQSLPERVRVVLRLAGLAGILASSVLFSAETAFPGIAAIVPVLSAVLVIASFERAIPGGGPSILAWRPVVFVGLLSYSWYLWHWPLLVMRRLYLPGERVLVIDVLLCGAALGVAYFSYRYVETPVRAMRWNFLRRKRWTFTGAATLTVAGLMATQAALLATSYWPPTWHTQSATGALEQRCTQLPGPFTGFRATDAECADGEPGGPIRVVIWGDSHAISLMPMLGPALRPHHVTGLQRSLIGCPPLLTATAVGQRGIDESCAPFNAAVVADLARRRELRGVILSARWPVYLTASGTGQADGVHALAPIDVRTSMPIDPNVTLGVSPYDTAGSTQTLQRSLRDTLVRLREMRLQVMVVAPVPAMAQDVPTCLARRAKEMCHERRSVVDEYRAPALAAIRAAAEGFDHVTIWDPIERFCDDATCFAERDGVVAYYDKNHLTAAWSRGLAPAAAPQIAWLLR